MKPDENLATTVGLGDRSYPVLVGNGLLDHLGSLIEYYIPNATTVTIVTSPMINELYGNRVKEAVGETKILLVPDGEEAKTLDQVNILIGSFLEHLVDRMGLIVAFGGGAVGDVAGFTSSIYLRGIRVLQVPTTLLAMVDSSIGGKTAVNHLKGKNLIGSFHQPSAVVADPILLESLPEEELRAGLSEIIKCGIIADSWILYQLDKKRDALLKGEVGVLSPLIARCVTIKADYVEQDEKDLKGIRAALNYGHTLGHAVEKISENKVRHGEAVSIGMNFAASIALKKGIITLEEYSQQKVLLESFGLPTKIEGCNVDRLLEAMRWDKKAQNGVIRFILPTGLGKPPILKKVSEEEILKVLEEFT
jgi:3-dehydroquinate synthase